MECVDFNMNEEYNYIDLFHGVCGFSYGAYLAGMKFKNHFCSDIEPYTQELYKLRFPDSIQLGDISKIDTDELKKYGDNWIITGGFPCQNISIAGKGEGIYGDRSSLWFEYWRIIRDLRPRFAIMENVGMLVHRGLREVLGPLAEIGYDAEWQDIRAEDVGAPHKRERIWIVAYPSSNRLPRERENAEIEKRLQQGYNKKMELASRFEGCCFDGKIPDTIIKHDDNTGYGASTLCRERSEETEIQGCISDTSSERLERKKSERESREYNGLFTKCDTGQWSTEPSICGVADGISNKLDGYQGRLETKSYQRINRLKGLGNSIIPQIAQILFEQIKPLL